MSSIDNFIGDINKQFGESVLMKGNQVPIFDKIPFSSPRLNYMTYGGIPIGKSTELFGPESGGKTTTAIDLAGNAQRYATNKYEEEVFLLESEIKKLAKSDAAYAKKELKKVEKQLAELTEEGKRKVMWIDTEHTFEDSWAKKNGINTEELLFFKPQQQSAEKVLATALKAVQTGQLILVIIDSTPLLVSEQKREKGIEGKTYGGNASVLTDFSYVLAPALAKHNTAMVAINQVRDDFSNPYNLYATPGGHAWKHMHALRLLIRKGKYFDSNITELKNSANEPQGNFVRVRIKKTKCCKPDRNDGFYTLNYGTGIDIINDTVDVAIYNDLMSQRGSWYYILEEGGVVKEIDGEEIKFQGRRNVVEYFENNEDAFEELYVKLNEKILE